MNDDIITKAAANFDAAVERIGGLESKFSGLNAELQELAQKATMGATPRPAGNGRNLTSAIQQKMLASTEFRTFIEKRHPTGLIDLGLSLKALTSAEGDQSTSDASGIVVQPDRLPVFPGYGARRLTLLEALPRRQTGSNTVTFNRMVGFTPAAAAQQYEGASKAEQTIVPELVSCPISTIAVIQVLSRQVVADEMGVTMAIRAVLEHTVLAKAESEVLNGDGTDGRMVGILQDATSFVPTAATVEDAIGEAIAEMEADGYGADLVVMHPADWFEVQSRKTTGSGEYLVGGPRNPAPPSLYGAPVVTTPAITQGTALVLDRRYVLLLDREQVTAELFPQDGDNVRKNLVTMRIEGRWGIALLDKSAALQIDLSALDSSSSA